MSEKDKLEFFKNTMKEIEEKHGIEMALSIQTNMISVSHSKKIADYVSQLPYMTEEDYDHFTKTNRIPYNPNELGITFTNNQIPKMITIIKEYQSRKFKKNVSKPWWKRLF